jgi:two-component system, OmpR family, sensor kinase
VSRIPIRIRLTLAFALAMAVVLAAIGAFLYVRLGSSLDEAIDESLQARLAEVSAQVAQDESVAPGGDPEERIVQVLDRAGNVVSGSPGLVEPLLEPGAVAQASEAPRWFALDEVAGIDGRVRVLAGPVEAAGGPAVVVVGTSLEDRDDAVQELLALLLVVAPIALVLASLLGYGLATLALRPVESMRVEAATISASEPGRRLPVPESHDEISRLGETLNAMLERLEAALERERSFVADAGHELRTPLALLKTELELALRRPRSDAELAAAVRSAADETDRLAQLAEDLLLLARSDRSQLPLEREPVQVHALLDAVATRFERRAQDDGRTIEVEVADTLELTADRLRLEQALGNLVDNALAHGDGAIRLSAREHDGRVELHVLDGGAGFPAEFLPHAFDRFTQADGARTGAGTGLGLALAEAVAAAHGGSAHAANRVEGGSDVWLSLPRR